MNQPLFRSLFVQKFTALFQATGGRRTSGWIALGVIAILYLLLLMATRVPAGAAGTADQLPTVPLQQATPGLSVGDGGGASPTDLSPEFMGEYDRLSAAENKTDAPETNAAVSTDAGSLTGTIIVSLLMVVGLAYAGIWGFKQYTHRQKGGALPPAGKHLVLQETQAIGPNQKLHLVRLGEELLLLGATDHNITCLARYDSNQFSKSFDDHLQAAHGTYTQQSATAAPVPLQESLTELRKVQRWQRGDDNA